MSHVKLPIREKIEVSSDSTLPDHLSVQEIVQLNYHLAVWLEAHHSFISGKEGLLRFNLPTWVSSMESHVRPFVSHPDVRVEGSLHYPSLYYDFQQAIYTFRYSLDTTKSQEKDCHILSANCVGCAREVYGRMYPAAYQFAREKALEEWHHHLTQEWMKQKGMMPG